MSGSAAKATRRDVRRALGNEGLVTLHGLTQLVQTVLIPTLEQQTDALNQHNRELDTHDRQLADFHERLQRLESDVAALRALTFPQRLKWALAGLF